MDTPVRLGFIGCGGMGDALAGASVATGLASVVSVYDADHDRSVEFAAKYGALSARNEIELLGRDDVDAVVIATPPFMHLGNMLDAASAGKHIFCEKPMAMNVEECTEAIEAAEDADVTLMIGQVLRYYEPFRTILRWKSEGRLGKILHASIWRVSGRYAPPGHWRTSKSQSGGFLLEISAHELDFMRRLMGRPETVFASLRKDLPSPDEIEDVVSVQVQFDSLSIGNYLAGAGFAKGSYGFAIRTDRGTIHSDAGFDSSRLIVDSPEAFRLTPEEIVFSSEPPVQAQMREWLTSLIENKPVPTPGEEGRATVSLAQAAYESAESESVVRL